MRHFIQKHIFPVLLLLILSIPLTIQTFQPGFFVGDDGEWMIIRSSAFHEALRDGQFPVRFLGRLNHEFGYPVSTFLYPGYLYLTEPFIILGFSFIDSIKIMFALTMVLSGIFAYFWLSKLFDKWTSLLGALVYLYTPYHLIDMYQRGSLGELLALAVVPFILWNIERKSLFFSVLGIAMLILSHNIMAALFLPIILVYAFLRDSQKLKKRLLHVAIVLLFSLGLSAFFWIPAIFELSNTIFNQTKISEWQNYFASFAKIGGLQLSILLSSVGILLYKKQLAKKYSLPVFFTVIGLLAVFFSSSLSAFLWHILPVSFIQFPFRFLSVEIVAVAFLSAFLLQSVHIKLSKIICAAIILIALAINAVPYLTNIKPFDKGEGFYITNQSTTTTRDEYMPIWTKEKPTQRAEKKIEIIKGQAEISNTLLNNKAIAFTVDASNNTFIQINKVYWPGWNASIDGKKTEINYQNSKGIMGITVSKGNHTVKITFGETVLRWVADLLSVISFVALVVYIVLRKKTKNNVKKK